MISRLFLLTSLCVALCGSGSLHSQPDVPGSSTSGKLSIDPEIVSKALQTFGEKSPSSKEFKDAFRYIQSIMLEGKQLLAREEKTPESILLTEICTCFTDASTLAQALQSFGQFLKSYTPLAEVLDKKLKITAQAKRFFREAITTRRSKDHMAFNAGKDFATTVCESAIVDPALTSAKQKSLLKKKCNDISSLLTRMHPSARIDLWTGFTQGVRTFPFETRAAKKGATYSTVMSRFQYKIVALFVSVPELIKDNKLPQIIKELGTIFIGLGTEMEKFS